MQHSKERLVLCLAFSVNLACQAGEPPAKAPEVPETKAPAATHATEANDLKLDPTYAAPVNSERPEEGESAEEAELKGDRQAARTVRYTPTPSGLKVGVDGVTFLVSAKPEKRGAGWAVNLDLEANVTDTEEYNLLTPARGPMAFSALVKSGKTEGQGERQGDQREGQGSVTLSPEKSFRASRSFPPENGKVLQPGDELDLEVGLWGFGADAASRRPIRDFCRVRMVVGKHTPSPVVLPPKSAASE